MPHFQFVHYLLNIGNLGGHFFYFGPFALRVDGTA
jgi:hypothetical protein